MAYAHTSRGASHGFAARFAAAKTDLRARWDAYRIYRRTFDELARLNDRDLADLGLHRSAIKAIALEAAYGDAR
ncbi:DUF1127 domain-containing protein [Aestuariibius sp. 2305UL40-4]|uniref:DUF1127 domain-containing protein n=1 Tax=Aestuariibius violaceus TaxID=3234132 RepID=UPI00345EA519